MSEEKDFELDVLWDREPVEVLEDRGDVKAGVGVCEQRGSRVLNGVCLGVWMVAIKNAVM